MKETAKRAVALVGVPVLAVSATWMASTVPESPVPTASLAEWAKVLAGYIAITLAGGAVTIFCHAVGRAMGWDKLSRP